MASIAAMGSGSVTSPMPQRISLLAASGWDSANACTRRPISGNKYPACNLRKLSLMLGMVLVVSAFIPYPERDGIKAPFRHASFPASRNGASSPDAVSTVPKRLLLSLCVSCSSPNVLSSLISLSFFPGKIPKNGQADARQEKTFTLRGIMVLKTPAIFIPPSAPVLLLKPELPGT